MNLSEWALRHRALMLFAGIAIAAAGIWSYLSLGRAEDPPFTIKQMVIVTSWPGATADETARLVTDPIERKIEEIGSLDYTDSYSEPGRSVVNVVLRDNTPPARIPGLWYQVRKKIGDIATSLPQGVQGPDFNDEFGDVYGFVYAITGDGFTRPELRHVAEDVREQLLGVADVGKVNLLGVQQEQLVVSFSPRKLAQLGLTLADISRTVQHENSVADGGFVETRSDRMYIRATPGLDGVARLAALPLQAQGRLIALGEIATISRGVASPPASMLLYDGKPALGIAVSMNAGGNILSVGHRLDEKLAAIAPTLPLGVRIAPIDDQARVVARDVGEFQDSFFEALAIVLLVSFVSLGWRTGIVVAISVPLVLGGVMVAMMLLGIDLQRISLGAMIIALGLLVDDAIISVETMAVKLEQGWDRVRAGSFAYSSTAFPMLTGTLVTAAGYLPVGLAQSSTGEYTQDIFRVVGLALILSWLVAVLFVPMIGAALLKPRAAGATAHDVYDTRLYRAFRRLVALCVRRRWWVIGATVAAFVLSLAGFARVPQQFFPSSDRLELIADLRLPEGASFAATRDRVEQLEAILAREKGIVSHVAYIGTGAPRFFLASSPELDQPNYAQLVLNMRDIGAREALLARLNARIDSGPAGGFDDVRFRTARLELGPPVGYPVQFRIVGPDAGQLRMIAARVGRAIRANPHIRNVSDLSGSYAKSVTVSVDENKARLLGLSSEDIATTLQTLLQGAVMTQYREGNDLIPVLARADQASRQDLAGLGDLEVTSANGRAVPLSQVARVVPAVEASTIRHRDRTNEITVRGDIADGTQAPVVTAQILPSLAAIKAALPIGTRIETGGAVEESAKGQASVNAGMPIMVLAMLTLLMVQLQSFGRVAMVILTAPLGLIGVTAGLLVTGMPFGFVAMLGFIALAGIIMRNSVILVDQIERDRAAGADPFEAILGATVRRARPIVLTATAAILGLTPLAFSLFWGPMAVAIMGGLLSATVLTLFFVPALYAAWMRVRVPRAASLYVGRSGGAAPSGSRAEPWPS